MRASSNSRCFYLGIIFLIGFAALIYQMYSARVLFIFFVENTHAVAMAVSSFLGGLAFSSLLFSRLTHHNTRSRGIICMMMIAAAIYGYVLLANFQWISGWLDGIRHVVANEGLAQFLKYLIMWVYLLLPAFFLGGAFPLINGLYLSSFDESARDTGTVYFWDTLGAIAGALIAGFVLLPFFGLRLTVIAAVAINLLVAALLMPRPLYRLITLGVLVLIGGSEIYSHLYVPETSFKVTEAGHMMPAAAPAPVPAPAMPSAAPQVAPVPPQVAPVNTNETAPNPMLDARFGRVVFQKESPFGRITVGAVDGEHKDLFINYRMMCGTGNWAAYGLGDSAMNQLSQKGQEVLNIGLGCGLTASKMAYHPLTKHLDIVEINPVIPEAARIFGQENRNVLDQPNVTLTIMNGAEWLRTTNKKYDAIVIDIEEVSIIYSSPLYTREYFQIIRDHLTEHGVFALWSFGVNPTFSRVMMNTLQSVFPHVQAECFVNGYTIEFYASMQPFRNRPDRDSGPNDQFLAEMAALDNHEVNTLENLALEKYYNSNRNFDLPDYYREKFVKP